MITRRNFLKATATGGALAAFGDISAMRTAIRMVEAPDSGYVTEGERQIPVISEVDIVITGGTSAAVSAAGAASRTGGSVFLVAPLPWRRYMRLVPYCMRERRNARQRIKPTAFPPNEISDATLYKDRAGKRAAG
ncbi:MAG: twin-arginine translocation signal domain-containing protein [Tannerella sp.]|nr:twin-arginine translocation signal domain-containing protein [Tannerella sp.]